MESNAIAVENAIVRDRGSETVSAGIDKCYVVTVQDMNDIHNRGFIRVNAANPQEAMAEVDSYGQMPGCDYRAVSAEKVVEKRYVVTAESMCSGDQVCIEVTAANPQEAIFIANDLILDGEYRAISAEEASQMKMKGKITEALDSVQEFGIDVGHQYLDEPCVDNDAVAAHLVANNVNWIPVRVGQTVYKICPICNPNHNGNCKHCAWGGCFGMTGCNIGVGVYEGGSYNDKALQIIPRKVIDLHIVTILKWWNIMYFATEDEAQKAMMEYDAIRKIEDRAERHRRYLEWEASRKYAFPFLEEDERKE
jgi:hypothetical protein